MTIPQTRPLARLAANEPRTMDVSFVYGNIIRQHWLFSNSVLHHVKHKSAWSK